MASRKQINRAGRQTIETGETNDMEMTDREELMQDAETGRRYKIAMEVLREFMDDQRECLIKDMEDKDLSDVQLRDAASKLRVMKEFRNVSDMNIQRGEIAEEELSHGE